MANDRISTEINGPNGERFRIESRLGSGSFGEVYKTIGMTSGIIAAVKMVPLHKLTDPTTLSIRTVLNEVRLALTQVNHPNVARVLHVDAGTEPAVGPYVMMEFVSGGNLAELLNLRHADSKPFTLDEALFLMRGIALGAQAINEHLIHRDIKPDNILLDGATDVPKPRIADFGVAKAVLDPTRPETFKGIQPVWYMAPEIWREEKHTSKIDIYSVGLVFYEILTLNHPLLPHVTDPRDFIKWREVHLTTPCSDVRAARPEVPLPLAKLLLGMVDKSPGNRPDWDEVIAGLSIKATSSTASAAIDTQLLAAFKRKADERLREDQAKTTAELARQRDAARDEARREEYKQSAIRLLARFDEIVEVINQCEPSYPIHIRSGDMLSRTYSLINGRSLQCEIFGYLSRLVQTLYGQILGGGYVGVAGGLGANLVLFGQPDDIASAKWLGVEVNVQASSIGETRLKWYREAGLSDETIRFLEHLDGDQLWRRDSPTHFGFGQPDLFYDCLATGFHTMGPYSIRIESDVIRTFNEVLKVGLLMPSNV